MALFLCPPSVNGFDGGAGARYQARREVTSFWYPTWLAQPAALVPGSRLLDCAPHSLGLEDCLKEARDHRHVIIDRRPSIPSAIAAKCRERDRLGKIHLPGGVHPHGLIKR